MEPRGEPVDREARRPRRSGERLKPLPGLLLAAVLVGGAVWPATPPASVGVIVLAGLLGTLGLAGWRLAALLLPGAGIATRITAATVLATALVTVPATVLGHFGLLFPAPFLLWGAVLALGTVFLPLAPPVAPAPSGPDPRPAGLRAVERGLALAAVTVLLGSTFVEVRAARYLPPGAFGFDDLSYHLTAVATWAARGDLAMPKFAVGDDATPYYPISSELVSWALLAPFRNNDVAARWSQLAFAIATLAAMASLAGRLGLRPRSVLPALAVYWSLRRVFPILALGAGNDHSTAFFLLAATDGALALARRRSVGAGLYAGAALGLLLGTKYLGVLFAPLPVAFWLLARLTGTGRAAAGGTWRPGLLAAGAAAVSGGYTYIRNLVTAGNPVFPAPVRLGGFELFAGREHATVAWRSQLPEWAIDLPGFLWRPDLWGPVAPWVLLPGALLAPLAAILVPRRRGAAAPGAASHGRWVEAAVLLLPVASFSIFLRLVHDHRDIRYFLAGVAVAALGWGYVADRLERDGRRPGAVLASVLRGATSAGVALAVVFHPEPPPYARPGVWLAVGATAGLLGAVRWSAVRCGPGRWSARHLGWPAAVAALVLVAVVADVAGEYPDRKLERRPLLRHVEERLIGPQGGTLAYVGHNAPYLYHGSRLQNRMVIVPTTTRDLETRVYTWGGTTLQPYLSGRYRDWLRNLERLGVGYVVVVRLGHSSPERPWMVEDPERFLQVAEHGFEEVWRFEP